MLELKDTISLMNSEYYKDRFVAEYIQTKIRYERLKTFNQRIEVAQLTGAEEPKHDCPLQLLKEQQAIMGNYLHTLELRAKIEHINLTGAISRLELSLAPITIEGGTHKTISTDSYETTSSFTTVSSASSGDTDGDNATLAVSSDSAESKPKRKYTKTTKSEVSE